MCRVGSFVFCILLWGVFTPLCARASLASKGYVDEIVSAITDTVASKADFDAHVADFDNPHAVSKAQVGLENVKNLDQTNADNLSSGMVAYDLLPVGDVAGTIVAGDDVRFRTIPNVAPTGSPPEGQVWIWFD